MTDVDTWQERRKNSKARDDDVRTEYERDYSRLIHSSAFRRLQSKTQTLGLGEGDFYRTRLTHSMEVAQIGTGILRFLKDKYRTDKDILKALPSHDLLNTICLSHDLGHPAYGHGGERALNYCMRGHGGFEGNAQTLRILSKLDKYTECDGINPTRRLLLGVLKYPISFKDAENTKAYGDISDDCPRWINASKNQKPPKCYYTCDAEIYDWIVDPLSEFDRRLFCQSKQTQNKHSKSQHMSLDTSIMELADDISYTIHDLEDSISLGFVDKRDFDTLLEEHTDLHALECDYKSLFSENSYERKDIVGYLINLFITNVHVFEVDEFECPLLKWRAKIEKPELKRALEILDIFKFEKVIKNESVQLLELKGQKIVVELFDALISDPDGLLPAQTRRLCSDDGNERVVCDYISGMTDIYAANLYEKIYIPNRGSIFARA